MGGAKSYLNGTNAPRRLFHAKKGKMGKALANFSKISQTPETLLKKTTLKK